MEEERISEQMRGIGESEGFIYSTEPVHYGKQLREGYSSAFKQGLLRGVTHGIESICQKNSIDTKSPKAVRELELFQLAMHGTTEHGVMKNYLKTLFENMA